MTDHRGPAESSLVAAWQQVLDLFRRMPSASLSATYGVGRVDGSFPGLPKVLMTLICASGVPDIRRQNQDDPESQPRYSGVMVM